MIKLFLFCSLLSILYYNTSFGADEKKIFKLKNETNEEIVDANKDVKIKDIDEINEADTIVLLALNKITAKSYKYQAKIGDEIIFERLIIKPLFCWKSSPEEVKENKALFSIKENKLNKKNEEIFFGWMFSSSTGISSLEHPMYDIILTDCLKNSKTAKK